MEIYREDREEEERVSGREVMYRGEEMYREHIDEEERVSERDVDNRFRGDSFIIKRI